MDKNTPFKEVSICTSPERYLGGMIVPLVSPLTMGVKASVTRDCCPPCRETAEFALFTTSEFFLGAFPGGGQQNYCGGLCHLETAFQVILVHIPTKNQPPALTPFSVQMRNWGPRLKVTWWLQALVGRDATLGNPIILLPWPGAGCHPLSYSSGPSPSTSRASVWSGLTGLPTSTPTVRSRLFFF